MRVCSLLCVHLAQAQSEGTTEKGNCGPISLPLPLRVIMRELRAGKESGERRVEIRCRAGARMGMVQVLVWGDGLGSQCRLQPFCTRDPNSNI